MARTSARIAAAKARVATPKKIRAKRAKKFTPVEAKSRPKVKMVSPIKPSTTKGIATGRVMKKRGRPKSEATQAAKRKVPAKIKKTQLQLVKEDDDELETSDLEYEVESILDSKKDKKGNTLYLVKWVSYPSAQNTWEPEVNLRNSTDLISEYDDANPEKP